MYVPKGEETSYKKRASEWIAAAVADKEKQSAEQKLFPPCNSEWSAEKGHRVWCTKLSGGIERNWVGLPRRFFYPGRRERCACIKDFGPPSADMEEETWTSGNGDLGNPHLKEYEGCDSKASSCKVRDLVNNKDTKE